MPPVVSFSENAKTGRFNQGLLILYDHLNRGAFGPARQAFSALAPTVGPLSYLLAISNISVTRIPLRIQDVSDFLGGGLSYPFHPH
jgi:hypothetical protein